MLSDSSESDSPVQTASVQREQIETVSSDRRLRCLDAAARQRQHDESDQRTDEAASLSSASNVLASLILIPTIKTAD